MRYRGCLLYISTKDAVNEFSKKYNCDLALAEEYLKVVRGIRNQQPFYITDEDGDVYKRQERHFFKV